MSHYMNIHKHIYMHTYAFHRTSYTYTYVHTHTHAHIHTYIHTHTHTYSMLFILTFPSPTPDVDHGVPQGRRAAASHLSARVLQRGGCSETAQADRQRPALHAHQTGWHIHILIPKPVHALPSTHLHHTTPPLLFLPLPLLIQVIHRDIKPENLILQDVSFNSPVKLVDFGFSTTLQQVQDKPNAYLCGTRGYLAPEVIKDHVWTQTGGDCFPFTPRTATRDGVDYDHAVPYDDTGPPGQTGPHNSGPLRRSHHRTKT
ncbi:hypothetical protein EON64_14160, partial [archaeon]